MPTTQGSRLGEWNAPPSLTGHHELAVPDAEVFVKDHEQCVEFVLRQCLQEVESYSGDPDTQHAIASDIASQIFDPGKDAVESLYHYLVESTRTEYEDTINLDNSPPADSDAEVIEMKTVYVVTRSYVETGKLLPFAKHA